jgi:hypothetical protein
MCSSMVVVVRFIVVFLFFFCSAVFHSLYKILDGVVFYVSLISIQDRVTNRLHFPYSISLTTHFQQRNEALGMGAGRHIPRGNKKVCVCGGLCACKDIPRCG